ncbi:MAG: ATP-binding protein [Actinomycetota bacterium]|nr:ATP-binding protein [Actinomycetota bacterium]
MTTSVTGSDRPDPAAGDRRLLAAAQFATVAIGTVYTLVVLLEPRSRVRLHGPDLRILIEVGGFCLVLFAALMLAIPDDDDIVPARNAFISALAVIAVTNAVFAVSASIGARRLVVDEGIAFYPWVAARYVSGTVFVLAGLGRPRWSLRRYLWAALASLVVLDVTLVAVQDHLPAVVRLVGADGLPELVVVDPLAHAVIQLIPATLFAFGAWLAGLTYVRSGAPVFSLLSLALLVQSFTQIHEVLHPAFLGPILTSADVFRATAFVLLAVGALLQLRRLTLERSRTVRAQQADLRAQDVLARELNTLLEQEQDFRAIVSHELATPIATIRAFIHVVASATDPTATDRVRQAVAGIRSETRRLSELVSRIDELRDLELSEFRCDRRPVRALGLLEEATAFVKGLPGSHPTTLRCADVLVAADPVRLGQAIRNVLANAAGYAPPNTPIHIDGQVADGGLFRIAVTDEGPGVPVEQREAVLRRYARGNNVRGKSGAGLGLYVASRIVAAHDGRIRLEDADAPGGGGTRVVIEVPLS